MGVLACPLDQMRERGIFDPESFNAWLEARHWSWKGLESGSYGLTIQQAAIGYVWTDPVRWCEAYLIEPDSGEPYRFFEYQKASIRAWNQDVVHQDGAECGKSREIMCLVLWANCTALGFTQIKPEILVAAPQTTHLNEIIDAIEMQVGVNEKFFKQYWRKPRKSPHTQLRFATPNVKDPNRHGLGVVDFRPGGNDGEAFRGVHAGTMLFFDEAAKAKNPKIFNEFWRAGKHGAKSRIYSVSDGDRSTEYFRLTQQAVEGLPADADGFRLFRWKQTMKPAPFWTPEREQQMIRRYGGKATPGYQRNVLGEHGQAENPIWPHHDLLACVVDLPQYRVLHLTADTSVDDLRLTGHRIKLTISGDKKIREDQWFADETIALSTVTQGSDQSRRSEVTRLLHGSLPRNGQGIYYAGADLGEQGDPTEIIVSEQVGDTIIDVLRVKAERLPYIAQCEVIHAIDEAFGGRVMWGCDLGSAGTAVVKDLLTLDAYATAGFDDRLIGYHFQQNVPCFGERGDALEDKDGNVMKAPAKHWATMCISHRLQAKGYAFAYDNEAINSMSTQTARSGSKWPIYSKKDDHHPDARRMQMLRLLQDNDTAQHKPSEYSVTLVRRGQHRMTA